MILEELLKFIPETEHIYVTCGEKEYLGSRHHYLDDKIFLNRKVKDKKIKTVQLCWVADDDAYLHIEVEE